MVSTKGLVYRTSTERLQNVYRVSTETQQSHRLQHRSNARHHHMDPSKLYTTWVRSAESQTAAPTITSRELITSRHFHDISIMDSTPTSGKEHKYNKVNTNTTFFFLSLRMHVILLYIESTSMELR